MKKIYKPFNRLVVTGVFVISCFISFAGQFPVTNTNNVGAGSLADAITQANTTPGTDTITFALPGGASMTIAPTTAFPAITEAVFINGYSQTGAVQGTIAGRTIQINIDGTGLPGGADIFTVNATGVTIAGFALYKAPAAAVRISNGANAFIWGNYIGTDSTGLVTGLGNSFSGIECNIFGGSPNSGIKIGVDGNGTNDVNEGNLICSNGVDGVFLWRTESSTIAGNIIGFSKNGLGSGFGNLRNGILVTVSSNGNTIGTNGDGIADGSEGNRIGNNTQRGIFVVSVSDGNIISGNIIGLDAGNTAAGNNFSGIEINPGSNNRIGTNSDGLSDAQERNIICSNAGDGIKIVGGNSFGFTSNSNANIISGNSIGTNGAGNLIRGNTGVGLSISSNNNFSVNDNIIGSNGDEIGDDLEGNLIANNLKGVVIETPSGTSTHLSNRISRNSIYDNTQLGIDHNNDGVSANDNGDGDTGPNELFNFPFITKANVQGGNLVIAGIAPADAFIEFYIADALGSEGKTYLFTAQVNQTYLGIADDSSGTGAYNDVTYGIGTDEKFGFSIPVVGLPAAVPAGSIILALSIKSTASINSTSEFGPAFVSTLPVRLLQFNGTVNNGIVSLSWITSQEQDNSHFNIERSANGTSFENIGKVVARGGLSNSYAFIDSKPGLVNFYRLKQIDKNGASAYSKVLVIRGDLDKIGVKVTPNPFRSSINISFQLSKEEAVTLRLFNQTGQLVKQQITKAGAGINTFNLGELNNLPAGNYTLDVRGESIRFKQQIIKQ
ncbi:MAG: T9SS type A sorting domain-containing protein [Chitinophagaceae bacterium]